MISLMPSQRTIPTCVGGGGSFRSAPKNCSLGTFTRWVRHSIFQVPKSGKVRCAEKKMPEIVFFLFFLNYISIAINAKKRRAKSKAKRKRETKRTNWHEHVSTTWTRPSKSNQTYKMVKQKLMKTYYLASASPVAALFLDTEHFLSMVDRKKAHFFGRLVRSCFILRVCHGHFFCFICCH